MINTLKFKGKVAENGLTMQNVADMLNISAFTLRKKITNQTPMTIGEMLKLKSILNLTDNETEIIFLNEMLQIAK